MALFPLLFTYVNERFWTNEVLLTVCKGTKKRMAKQTKKLYIYHLQTKFYSISKT